MCHVKWLSVKCTVDEMIVDEINASHLKPPYEKFWKFHSISFIAVKAAAYELAHIWKCLEIIRVTKNAAISSNYLFIAVALHTTYRQQRQICGEYFWQVWQGTVSHNKTGW